LVDTILLVLVQILESNKPSGKDQEAQGISHQDTVMITFTARLAETRNDTDGPIIQQTVKSWLVGVGDGDVVPALEMGIRFMETGQTAHIWAHSKYALGPGIRRHDAYSLPPNSNILYEVTVSQIVMDTSRLNPYFSIQKALTRKTIANDIYQFEWSSSSSSSAVENNMAVARALRLYQRAAADMQTLLGGVYFQQVEADHPQRDQARQIMLDSLNNIAAVQMRQGEYHKAKEAAVQVLQQDSKNLKGLMRAAKAALLDPASTMEEAQAALEAAENQVTYKNPNEEKELKTLRAQFKQKKKEYKTKSKEMFANKLQQKQSSTEKDASDKQNVDGGEKAEETIVPGSSPNNNDDETEEVVSPEEGGNFWQTRMFQVALQIFQAFLIYFLFRYLKQNKIVANDVPTMEEDLPLTNIQDEF
jgi:hypothetical protein